METTETVAQEAKRLLIEVPAEDFITGSYTDGKGRCCAIGHYQRLRSDDPSNYHRDNCTDREGSRLRKRSKEFIWEKHGESASIAGVNNQSDVNGYTEEKIKDRVIHLLDDMIADGY